MAPEHTPEERISARKAEHIDSALQNNVTSDVSAGWDDVVLVHEALPEIDKASIEMSVYFLGHHLRYPLVISALTGGHPRAQEVNRVLAKAAEHFSIAMGVGSQRAMVVARNLSETYTVTRSEAPQAFLMANVGVPQLVPQGQTPSLSIAEIEQAIQSIGANALVLHLNFLQECMQEGGDTNAASCLEAIEAVVRGVSVPVIAKETGAGISRDAALALRAAGVRAIDVGGVGGSSMPLLEANRARSRGNASLEQLCLLFAGWGIPTAVSICEARTAGLPLIATGGVRSGLDAAKALALGATLVGVGRPMLAAALEGFEAVATYIENFLEELRIAMFLTGSRTLHDLQHKPLVTLGRTREWLEQRPSPGDREHSAEGKGTL